MYIHTYIHTSQIDFTEMDMVALQRATRLRLHSLSYPQIDLLLYRLFDAPLVDKLRDKYVWVLILKRMYGYSFSNVPSKLILKRTLCHSLCAFI